MFCHVVAQQHDFLVLPAHGLIALTGHFALLGQKPGFGSGGELLLNQIHHRCQYGGEHKRRHNLCKKNPDEAQRAKELIAEIAALTGWNLSLGDQVYDGKGGMTVTFGADCALFTGPPEVQNEEFHVYSAEELAETVLDNIGVTISRLQPYTGFPG